MLKRLWNLLSYVLRSYGSDNCGQLAAAISYYVLFSIVPFTVAMVSVFGLVAGGRQLQEEVMPSVVDFIGLPLGDAIIQPNEQRVAELYGRPALAEVQLGIALLSEEERTDVAGRLTSTPPSPVVIAGYSLSSRELSVRYDNSVSSTLRDVARVSGPLTVVGLVAVIWSATAMFGSVRRALNVVWKVGREKPYFQQKLRDLQSGGGLGLLLLASVVGTALLRVLREKSDTALGPFSSGTGVFWGALPYVLPLAFSVLVFALVYRFVPAAKVSIRQVAPGAVLAGALFELLKNVFAFYVTNFRAYDLVYGSLGGILLFLTAVYFSAVILLFCAELTVALPRLKAGEFDPVYDPTKPRLPFVRRAARDVGGFIQGLFVTRRAP